MKAFFKSVLNSVLICSLVSSPAFAKKKSSGPQTDPMEIARRLAALHLTLVPIQAVAPMSSEMYQKKSRELYPDAPRFVIADHVFDGRGDLLFTAGTDVFATHKIQSARRAGRKGIINLNFHSAKTASGKRLNLDGEFRVDGIATTGELVNKSIKPLISGFLTSLAVAGGVFTGISIVGGAASAGILTAVGIVASGVILALPFSLYLLKKGKPAAIQEGAIFQIAIPDPAYYPDGTELPNLSKLLEGLQ